MTELPEITRWGLAIITGIAGIAAMCWLGFKLFGEDFGVGWLGAFNMDEDWYD